MRHWRTIAVSIISVLEIPHGTLAGVFKKAYRDWVPRFMFKYNGSWTSNFRWPQRKSQSLLSWFEAETVWKTSLKTDLSPRQCNCTWSPIRPATHSSTIIPKAFCITERCLAPLKLQGTKEAQIWLWWTQYNYLDGLPYDWGPGPVWYWTASAPMEPSLQRPLSLCRVAPTEQWLK